MIAGILCILLTGFLWGVVGMLHSTVARRRMNFPAYAAVVSLSGGIVAWLFYADWGRIAAGEVSRTGDLVVILGIAALMSVLAFLLAQRAMRRGHHAGTWTITQASMIFPFIAGVTFWEDPLTVFRFAGMAVILGGIVAFGRSSISKGDSMGTEDDAGPSGRWFLPALIAFGLLGVQQTLTQTPSRWAGWTDIANLRVPIIMTGIGLMYALIAVAKRTRPRWGEIGLGLVGAVVGITSQVCLFSGMDALSEIGAGAIVYPIAIGACILTFALYSITILREPTNRFHYIGLTCCLAGVVIIAL